LTAPPLPETPCVRVRLDYLQSDAFDAGSRFFLSYAGASPTGANCIALATAIATAWSDNVASSVSSAVSLKEVDVLDIASNAGLSGQWTGTDPGTGGATQIASQVAGNVEFGIARRYRGGKPRMFVPGPPTEAVLDAGHFSPDYIANLNTGIAGFFTAIEALDIGAMGALAHVNLSYYDGFTNITNSSGRTRAVPKYRPTALVEAIVGYSTKAVYGSQKRRRTATTY
jgi:hypothetical protein